MKFVVIDRPLFIGAEEHLVSEITRNYRVMREARERDAANDEAGSFCSTFGQAKVGKHLLFV